MKDIEEKIFFIIPKANVFPGNIIHSPSYIEEVLQKFDSRILIGFVEFTKIQGNPKHIEREHSHPRSSIGLFKFATVMMRMAPIN